jgi:hypothetical protein
VRWRTGNPACPRSFSAGQAGLPVLHHARGAGQFTKSTLELQAATGHRVADLEGAGSRTAENLGTASRKRVSKGLSAVARLSIWSGRSFPRAAEGGTRSVGPVFQTGHSEASCISSPRSGRQNRSVPQISIVEINSMSAQKQDELRLKSHVPVVFLLSFDVPRDTRDVGAADAESTESALPCKCPVFRKCVMDPLRRTPLQLSHCFRNRDRSLVCRPLCGLDRGPYRLPGLKAGTTDLALPLAAARVDRQTHIQQPRPAPGHCLPGSCAQCACIRASA